MFKATLSAVLVGMTVMMSASEPRPREARHVFDRLKTLVGEWQGRDEIGHDVEVTFRLVSNGTALLSELREHSDADGTAEDMVTMITIDGSRVLATHYCSAGNQPRMAAVSGADDTRIAFTFVDGTNLGPHASAHMQRLVVTFVGGDRHSEEWVYRDHDRENRNVMNLRRAGL